MNIVEKIKNYFRNLRVKNKMLTAFLPLIIIPILIVGFTSYFIFQNNAAKKTIDDRINSSYLIKQRIEQIFVNTKNCSDMITFGLNDIIDKIKEGDKKGLSDIERKNIIENKLNFSLLVFSDVQEAIFVDNNQSVYTANDRLITGDSYEQLQNYIKRLKETEDYDTSFEMTKFSFEKDKQTYNLLPVGRKVIEIQTGETVGYLLLFVNEKNISNMFKQVDTLKTSQFILINDSNRIISSTEEQDILKNISDPILNQWIKKKDAAGDVIRNNNTKVVYTKLPLNQGKWLIVYRVNLDELMGDFKVLRGTLVITMFLCVLFTVIVSLKLSNMIVKPMQILIKTMEKVEENQYKEKLKVNSEDEVAKLTHTYNKMIERIKQLIREIEEEQKVKRKYELAVLQNQIKPHFLYNTLDVVYSLADLGRIKEVKKSTKALAEFYRGSLSGGNEIISIREELNIIQNYLYIQHIRYEDVFDYTINFVSNILDCKILKLTIQPLVENSIYHGLKNKESFGKLQVNGYLNDNIICIEVKDNGIGMTEEVINEILSNNKPEHYGIGLSNINHRIKLFFGDEYGIEIKSEKGQGTIVTVRIPMQKYGGD